MFTKTTQIALAVLYDLSCGNDFCLRRQNVSEEELAAVLHKLEGGNLIQCSPDKADGVCGAYRLCCSIDDLSLLDVLEAIGEPIYCHRSFSESYYMHYGEVARKMGVMNCMLRTYLASVKTADWQCLM